MALSTFALAVSFALTPGGLTPSMEGASAQDARARANPPGAQLEDSAAPANASAASPELAGLVLSTRLVGHGCCSKASPPALSATLSPAPASARSVELCFSGEGAPVGGSGWILLGAPLACSEDLGNGGHLHLDRTQLVRLGSLSVDVFGAWSKKLPVPAALADLTQGVVVQAMFPDPQMSIGFGLSDALELRLGLPLREAP